MNATSRREEIRELLSLSPEEVVARSEGRLVVLPSLEDLHRHFADAIIETIAALKDMQEEVRLILPFGPTGQYPYFVERVNRERLSLKHCLFFFMDEYAREGGTEVEPNHPLSFRGPVARIFSGIDEDLRPSMDRVVFPGKDNLSSLAETMAENGGIDACFGGVGIHGHLAFNEPEEGVSESGPRVVALNDFTVTINAIRDEIGGDLENFPRKALTIGMKQILGAKKIRIYCRNDIPGIDWANTVLRLAVLGTPGDDYPVTHIQNHPDWQVTTDENTLASPKHILP